MCPTSTLNFTPLESLDGVALDTETTGLSVSDDRVVQIAAVDLLGGQKFESHVNPGVAISASSTAIHGIRNEDIDGAPDPKTAIAELVDFIAQRTVIGHSIAFDLAILSAESVRSHRSWPAHRALDIRYLAMAVAPPLPDFSLDAICSWLGVEIHGRHTAPGDAAATAEAFRCLVPKLRARGIRTLAEAEAVCRVIGARHGDVAADTTAAADEIKDWAGELDGYAYSTTVGDVMSAPPVLMPASTRVSEAFDTLIAQKISSILVGTDSEVAGIVTERDLIRAVAGNGARALEAEIGDFMSAPLECVEMGDLLYRAIGRIGRHGMRHLGVCDANGAIVGVVTTRNLLQHRSSAAIALGDEIQGAMSAAELGLVWAQVPSVARSLCERGTAAVQVARTISSEIRALTRRAAEFAAAELVAEGKGPAPHTYSVFVLGSAGRGESLIAADQDNAIVIDAATLTEGDDAWFAAMGDRMATILDSVGIAECKGGVMARNSAWRGTVDSWRAEIGRWIERQNPKDLLNVDIFFDARCVSGDERLLDRLWRDAFALGSRTPSFLRALEGTIADIRPPLTMFSGFKVDAGGRVDLKLHGLFPLVSAARILAIKVNAPERGTGARYGAAAAAGQISHSAAEEFEAAHHMIMSAVLAQQLEDVDAGRSPGTKVDPRRLSKSEQKSLREAIRRSQGAILLTREGMI